MRPTLLRSKDFRAGANFQTHRGRLIELKRKPASTFAPRCFTPILPPLMLSDTLHLTTPFERALGPDRPIMGAFFVYLTLDNAKRGADTARVLRVQSHGFPNSAPVVP